MKFELEEKYLDYILVPAGLLVLSIYHYWLLITITNHPYRTIIGLNRAARRQWIFHIMTDTQKNGILAVQTLRNNLMASTLLATISVTLSSLISAIVTTSTSKESPYTGYMLHQFKYFAILVCFLVAFFCNMQCTRYYAHASFSVNVPYSDDQYVEFVAQMLDKGGLFWSLGLRAFYYSFPLLLWIFGPVIMFASSCLMTLVLYSLDTTDSSYGVGVCSSFRNKNSDFPDVERAGDSIETRASEDTSLYNSLMRSTASSRISNC